jgi:hypothetical protein
MNMSRRMRWKGHATILGGDEECVQSFSGRNRRKETARKKKT